MTVLRMTLVVALAIAMAAGIPWNPVSDGRAAWAGTTVCDVDTDCDLDGYTPNQGDCDDTDASVYPGAPELADGIDNNCNGVTDEGLSVFATGGPVSVQLTASGAGFVSRIYLFTPGGNNVGFLGTNQETKTVDLGTFPAGTELIFGIVVDNQFDHTEDVFYMGPACRNFDSYIHATARDEGGGVAAIGFEDLRAGVADNDYSDALLSVTGVTVGDGGGCGGLGHFMCYSIKATKGNVCADGQPDAGKICQQEEDCIGGETDETDLCVPNKLTGLPGAVSLLDDVESKNFQVKKPAALCNPASKTVGGNIELTSDPLTHLESFSILQSKGEAKFVKQTRQVNNQFGSVNLELQKAERLMVPSAKQHQGTEPPPAPDPESHSVDHFKCYKVKPIGTFAPITVGSVDQFGQPKTFTLKKPTRLCLAADKNAEGIKDEEARLLCYQALPVKGQPKHVKVNGLFVNNQFGPDQVDTLKETEFCVPSTENTPA